MQQRGRGACAEVVGVTAGACRSGEGRGEGAGWFEVGPEGAGTAGRGAGQVERERGGKE